jgi:hypothetical protein
VTGIFAVNVLNVKKDYLANLLNAKDMRQETLPVPVGVRDAMGHASDAKKMTQELPTLATASLMLLIAKPVVLDPIRNANAVPSRSLEEPSVLVAHI